MNVLTDGGIHGYKDMKKTTATTTITTTEDDADKTVVLKVRTDHAEGNREDMCLMKRQN